MKPITFSTNINKQIKSAPTLQAPTIKFLQRILTLLLNLSLLLLAASSVAESKSNKQSALLQDGIVAKSIDPSQKTLQLFYKDSNDQPFKNTFQLKKHLKQQNKNLAFATNGGIFMENLVPLGLYIEKGKQIQKINRVKKAFGNFYIQPNGIFQISQAGKATITATTQYKNSDQTQYALQSGPLLVIDNKVNRRFITDSDSRKIRNGVGILDNGDVVFAMSTKRINFYDFAQYFISIGCKQALYLDGSISMFYDPEQGRNYSGGKYSVIIAEVIDN
jgi:uncharacterized protein YigE (DUF2233 family)